MSDGWRFNDSQQLWEFWWRGEVTRTMTAEYARSIGPASREWWTHLRPPTPDPALNRDAARPEPKRLGSDQMDIGKIKQW